MIRKATAGKPCRMGQTQALNTKYGVSMMRKGFVPRHISTAVSYQVSHKYVPLYVVQVCQVNAARWLQGTSFAVNVKRMDRAATD